MKQIWKIKEEDLESSRAWENEQVVKNIELVSARQEVLEYVNEQLEECHQQVISARYEVISNYDEQELLSLPENKSFNASNQNEELYEKQEVI